MRSPQVRIHWWVSSLTYIRTKIIITAIFFTEHNSLRLTVDSSLILVQISERHKAVASCEKRAPPRRWAGVLDKNLFLRRERSPQKFFHVENLNRISLTTFRNCCGLSDPEKPKLGSRRWTHRLFEWLFEMLHFLFTIQNTCRLGS